MSNGWKTVPLGEVLRKSEEWISIEPKAKYKEVTVRLWGKGVVLRRVAEGSEIAATWRNVVRANQFILSRIDARHGALGLIPDSLDGAVVSTDFPVFSLNEAKMLPAFLNWLSKTQSFIDICKAASVGTTNRIRLKEEKFLAMKLPLPSLTQQQRIIVRIEELAAKIAEAQKLRQETTKSTEHLLSLASAQFFHGSDKEQALHLGTLATRITKGESPEWQGFSYQDSGVVFIRSENVLWSRLELSKRTHIPVEFHQKLSRSHLQAGDVLINLVGASIGRSCVVPDNLGDANVNQAVAVITPNAKQLDSQYLMRYLISSTTQIVIHRGKVETARPNISLTDLRNLKLPVPPLSEQRRIVEYIESLQAKVDSLKELQAQTAAELDALLPAVLDKAFKGEL